MSGKTCKTIIVSSLLISILFTAFLSTPMSMTAMEMGAMHSQMNSHSKHNTEDNHSTMPCCDMIGTSCMSLAFITPQFDSIALSGGNNQVVNSNLAIHFIIIQNTTPPPKA